MNSTMARLRIASPELVGIANESGRRSSEMDLRQSRNSPRKNPAVCYRECRGTDDDEDDSLPTTTLKPKRQLTKSETGIRIVSKPLSASINNLGLEEFTLQPKRTLSTACAGRTTHQPKSRQRHTNSKPSRSVTRPSQSGVSDSTASEHEAQEDSGDDLLDPWELLGLPRKTTGKTIVTTASDRPIDLVNKLTNLSLDTKDESLGDATAQREARWKSIRIDCSSDCEDSGAIIKYSPPRLLRSPEKQKLPDKPNTPPQSPSKSRLQSPTKARPAIPTPPLRESLDAFWNPNTINDWNDQYSPQKTLRSPRKLQFQPQTENSSPTSSPRKLQSPSRRTKAELEAKKDFAARKHGIAIEFLAELDCIITEGRIGELTSSTGGVRFVWSKTLNSTAGRANWRRETIKTRMPDGTMNVMQKNHASIQLAEKVIDDEHRLLNVIAHEFCHLCNFIISGIKDQPHGKQFKTWGRKCTKAFGGRGVEVTTKHDYKIDYKYVWQCSNEVCGAEFKRHSKSIDPAKHTCGGCRGSLVQTKPVPRKDVGAPATGYAAFVKEHFADVKRQFPGASQKDVMAAVGRRYRSMRVEPSVRVAAIDEVDSEDLSAGNDSENVVNDVARVLNFVTLNG